MIYTICNTYVRHTQYDPADGEFAASVGIRNVDKVFPWWIPILVVVDVLIFGVAIFEIVWIFVKGRKRHLAMKAAAAAGVEYVEPTRSYRPKKPRAEKAEKAEKARSQETETLRDEETAAIAAANESEPKPDEHMADCNVESETIREQMLTFAAELSDLTEYMNKLKEADEKKRISAEKRREANKNKPKKPKAPSQKQQIADMQKEIEELKKLLIK